MMNKTVFATILAVAFVTKVGIAGQDHPSMPPSMTHEEHLAQMAKEAEMKKRGAAAMGFDQDTTTHHFHLLPNGGSIEVSANNPSNEPTRKQIREHLKQIAGEFSKGIFDK